MSSRFFSFIAGRTGAWQIESIDIVKGATLTPAARLEIVNENVVPPPTNASWCLRGVTSYERYVVGAERQALERVQPPLGRKEATRAALIPVKKSAAWWRLSHDQRREVFEERSAHIATGLKYLPAVARRLHHSYDLGEPFDFLTWFEYAERDAAALEQLVKLLRATPEWDYVEREER